MKKKHYRDYVSALTDFIRIIRLEYQPGDRIPPSVEMSKRLGISRSTYTKVLADAAKSRYVVLNGHQGVRIPEKPERKAGLYFGCSGESYAMVVHPVLAAEVMKSFKQADISMEVIYRLDPVSIIRSNVSVLLVFPMNFTPEQWRELKETTGKSGISMLYLSFLMPPMQPFPGCYFIYDNPEYAVYELHSFLKEKQYRSAFVFWRNLADRKSGSELTCFPEPVTEKTIRRFCSMLIRRKPDAVFLEMSFSGMTNILTCIENNRSWHWNPAIYLSSAIVKQKEKIRAMFPDLNFRGTVLMDPSVSAVVITAMIQKFFEKRTPFQTIGVNNFLIQEDDLQK